MGKSIVDIQNMGDALRNTGYKNIESAAAEIVDNSIEANASDVFIIMSEGINPSSGRKVVTEIGFLDNGDGMDSDILGGCLGIGATTRKARKGMGRFGVGLPQASLHVSPEVLVYSWQDGIENCQMVFLNIDKVKSGEQTELEDPKKCTLPDKYSKYIKYKTADKEYDFSKSGTLVIWSKCDNLLPKSRGPLQKRLEFEIGKKFRYFIYENKTSIKIVSDENQEFAVDVFPNDPLMLMDRNYVLGKPENPQKAEYKCSDGTAEPVFELYTAGGTVSGETEVSVKYLKDGKVCKSKVKVRFSKVRDEFYDLTAFPPGGKNPGSGEIGGHVKKLEGISVIRAGREIDFGRFDYYNPTNEPQHRWWGCEIIFEPELDELFGVTNNKQHVNLSDMSGDRGEDIDYDEEVQPIWDQLQSCIAPTIKAMYDENEATRKTARTIEQDKTPSTNIINAVEEEEEDEEDIENPLDNITPEEFFEIGKEELESQGIENPTEEQVRNYFSDKVKYAYEDNGERAPAFDYKVVLGTTRIVINTGHKFYKSFLSKIYDNVDTQTTFELFLASLLQSVVKTDAHQPNENNRLITAFYTKLNQYIEKQLNPVNVK